MAEKRVKLFRNPLDLCDEDYLSNSIDDCLLAVFSFLDRKSLDVLKGVSQKMNYFTSKFDHIKEEARALIICQDDKGHSFYLMGNSDLSYHHQWINERPMCVRRRSVFSEDFGDDPEPIPTQLYENLHQLCEKYSFTYLSVQNTWIDEPLLVNCGLLTAQNSLKEIDFDMNKFDGDLDISKFTQFLLHSKAQNLSIKFDGELYEEQFNAKFLREFSAGTYSLYSIDIYNSAVNIANWDATGDLLPVICRYDFLQLPAMTLTADLVLELIMMGFRLPHQGGDVHWEFSFFERISEQQLRDRMDSESDLEIVSIDLERENKWTMLKRINSDLHCTFRKRVDDIRIVFYRENT